MRVDSLGGQGGLAGHQNSDKDIVIIHGEKRLMMRKGHLCGLEAPPGDRGHHSMMLPSPGKLERERKGEKSWEGEGQGVD